MGNVSVAHLLKIYQARKEMQDLGITNPPQAIKNFTDNFIERLKEMPLHEEITIKDGTFFDIGGRIIISIPNR